MSHWVKVERRDDWGAQKFEPDVSGLHGQLVTVRWPDGHRSEHVLAAADHRESVSEQGSPRPYDVTTKVYGVRVDVHGIRLWVGIEELELQKESVGG